MPSPLLYIAAGTSGLQKTVHEYRTRLSEQLADQFNGSLPRHRRGRLYDASVKIVDAAMPEGTRHLTLDMIENCREKLRCVAVFLRDSPQTPPTDGNERTKDSKSALADAKSRLAAAKRKIERNGAAPNIGLAVMRQELHTAARDVAERRAREVGSSSAGGPDCIRSASLNAQLAHKTAEEAIGVAERQEAWAKQEIKLSGQRLARETAQVLCDGRELVCMMRRAFFSPLFNPSAIVPPL